MLQALLESQGTLQAALSQLQDDKQRLEEEKAEMEEQLPELTSLLKQQAFAHRQHIDNVA